MFHQPSGSACRIAGLGVYRPAESVSSDTVAGPLGLDAEWIRSRTGITARRVAGEAESVVDMAAAAGAAAIDDSGLAPDLIDCVITATVSHGISTPAAASVIADRLNLDGPAAFDISAACSGFSYGLELARSLIAAGSARHVLVIGAERMTDLIDPTDANTAILFGDGAGAVVVAPSDSPEIAPIVWGGNGAKADLVGQAPTWIHYRDHGGPEPRLRMNGQGLFLWVIENVPDIALRALDAAGLTVADLDAFIPHQANQRMIDCLATALDLPDTVRVATDIADQGNASAASIPLAMARLLDDHPTLSGGTALTIGFGAGLTFGAQVLRLPGAPG
ncbi:beta-ketoacyl-ACP synthase 3 [Nocardia tengchongensis]|uniref:beta-ketoacyl-ACP synthase 3 n=1 Tax=Nocardia tengchongensis TaxID=2055889 RepID=UPI00368A4FBC